MRLGKEIERLRQRVHKLSIEKDPPTLRMVIVKDEETPQELSASCTSCHDLGELVSRLSSNRF